MKFIEPNDTAINKYFLFLVFINSIKKIEDVKNRDMLNAMWPFSKILILEKADEAISAEFGMILVHPRPPPSIISVNTINLCHLSLNNS